MNPTFMHFYHSVFGRLVAILSTLGYLTMLLILQNNRFRSTDPVPLYMPTPTEHYNLATPVEVGLHIHHFPVFSFERKEFVVDGIVWFRFATGTVPLETLEQFSFSNSTQAHTNELVSKSKPLVKLLGDRVQVAYHIQVGLSADLDFKQFPLCDHTLHIMLHNKHVTPTQIRFTSGTSYFTLASQSPIKNWHPEKTEVSTGMISSLLEAGNPGSTVSYPCTLFSINFKNVGMRDLMSLYFPMLVLFFVALFSLLLELADNTARLTYIATVVPVLVLFRLVVEGASPSVGYATHVDFVYYLLVLLSLVILLFQIYALLMLTRNAHAPAHDATTTLKKRLYILNDSVFMGSLFSLLVGMTYLYLSA